MELSFANFKDLYYKNTNKSDIEIAKEIRDKFDSSGLRIFGALFHSENDKWNEENVNKYLSDLEQQLKLNKILGGEYVTFQIWLPDKYLYGDGSYRNNDKLLDDFVSRIKILQNLCYENGLNFYVETHVGRLSEDPQAFVKIMEKYRNSDGDIGDDGYYNSFEINGDLSHYICRGMLNGEYVDKILNNMEHTHVRMCRVYGDLSVDVDDPVKDWNEEDGVTRNYWLFTKKGFKGGLSSRVIVGESGPMHLVQDALEQDKKMVPLLREMANYCDLQIQQNQYDTQDFNPFQQ